MADALSPIGRNFYEKTREKLVLSIVLGAAAMMLLGFTSNSAGLAASYESNYDKIPNGTNKNLVNITFSLSRGYGFGAFAYIMGSVLLIAAACNVSPLFCSGTENEKKMIRNPQEIEQYYDGNNNATQMRTNND